MKPVGRGATDLWLVVAVIVWRPRPADNHLRDLNDSRRDPRGERRERLLECRLDRCLELGFNYG